MRWLLLLAFLLPGCADVDPQPVAAVEEPVAVALGVGSDAGRAAADAAAQDWNSMASILNIAAFEGVDFDSRWAGGFDGNAMSMDGRSHIWSYSYAIRTPLTDPVDGALANAGQQSPRLGYVVFVDEEGDVIGAYETTDDEEGISPYRFLRDDLLDSQQAAQSLVGSAVGRYDEDATTRVAILADGWDGEDLAAWVFEISTDTLEAYAIVDAVTGELIEEETFET